jgi:hypothetical protein
MSHVFIQKPASNTSFGKLGFCCVSDKYGYALLEEIQQSINL